MVDGEHMREAIEGMAGQLRDGDGIGAEAGARLPLPAAVVIAGMGGSAMAGELLRGLVLAECAVPVTRVRGFGIPGWAGPGTLVVCISYSGDTVETLSCAEQAHRQGATCSASAWAAGWASWRGEWGTPFAQVPGGLQPRAALGYLFGAMAGAFGACGLAVPGIAGECAEGVDAGRPRGGGRAGRAAGRPRCR